MSRHVPGVDDASVPCPLISRCEEHSAHICCRHAFLPPSFLLSPVRVSCPERTFLKVRASEHGQAQSQCTRLIDKTRQDTCLVKPDLSTPRPDDQSMFTLPSFTEQFPLPPPFSTRQGASRRGTRSSIIPTDGKAPLPSREGRSARVDGALMRDGNERKDRNCARAVCSS